ncbi:MAG: hypothetical protein IJ457_03995 [Clostridia bacterium]|nr:hypothetical protein [Clostridia bacterium]
MKKFVKYTFIVLLCIIIGFLILRTILYSDKSVLDHFEISDASRTAYADHGKLDVLEMEYKNRSSENGYFCAYSLYYVKETGELQVTVRYNTSAFKYTSTNDDADIEFLLMKRVGEDLSENMESAQTQKVNRGPSSLSEREKEENYLKNYTGEYFYPTKVETATRYGMYHFRKLTFENVPLVGDSFDAEDVIVVMVPSGTVAPPADAEPLERYKVYRHFFDRQYMHYTGQPYDEYKLSGKDVDKLTEE